MAYGSTPPSQRARRIGFSLTGGSASSFLALAIRPEDLTRVEPSRLAVQQTLGGAWADSWDRGITTIRISGTTGWRGAAPGSNTVLSGEDAFRQLHDQSFLQWHAQRDAVIQAGGDPSTVELAFLDELDGFTDVVAPKVFTLRRSKQSPLMIRFNIEMLVLRELGAPATAIADGVTAALTNPQAYLAGGQALTAAASGISALAGLF